MNGWSMSLTSDERLDPKPHPCAEAHSLFPTWKSVGQQREREKGFHCCRGKGSGFAGAGMIQERNRWGPLSDLRNSFFQTNSLGAERLYGKFVEFAELTGKETVVDLLQRHRHDPNLPLRIPRAE